MSSDATYIKGGCTHCGGHIEFPREAIGAEVACPHCGATTALLDNLAPIQTAPQEAEEPPPAPQPSPAAKSKQKPARSKPAPSPAEEFSRECPGCGLEVSIKAESCPSCGAILIEKKGFNLKLLIPVAIIVVLAAGFFAIKSGKLKLPKRGNSTKSTAPATGAPPKAAAPAKPVKRSGKFEVVSQQIEKTPGTSLMYVVGGVLNDTDKQKFSVRVTFALSDKSGKVVGEATDYVTVIEPGETWNFRALILDASTESAKLTSLEAEDPL